MKKTVQIFAIVVSLGISSLAHAATPFAELSAARANDVVGAEIGLGAKLQAGGFALKPQAVAFVYHGDTPGYRYEGQSNGTTVCRDTSNGRYSDESNCDRMKVEGALKLELTYTVETVGEFGIGARVAKASEPYKTVTPYLTVSKNLTPNMALKLNGGRDYVALGFVFGR
jgi:hypothetical protein